MEHEEMEHRQPLLVARLQPKLTGTLRQPWYTLTECGTLLEGGRSYTEPIILKLEGVYLFKPTYLLVKCMLGFRVGGP